MAKYLIILPSCFLLLSVINFSTGVALKDTCLTAETQNGKCIPLGECPSLLKLLKKRPIAPEDATHLKKANCGFQGVHPKVCCPLDTLEMEDVTTPEPIDSTTIPSPSIPEIPPSTLLPDFNECGYFSEDRIFLGDEAQLDGYPWTVLLEYETPTGKGFHCGGVLINKRYVLTAAHCISGKGIDDSWKLVNVRLGEYDRDSEKDCDSYSFAQFDCCCSDDVINVEIEEQIVHEEYDPNNKAQYHDIALLRLAENIKFTEFVRPICLQPIKDVAKASLLGQSGTISGWGVSKISSNSNKKQWAKMKISNNTECETAYAKHELHLLEDQLCAFPLFDRNSCSQDSGGALVNMIRSSSPSMNYFAVGVMSIANPICGLKEYPVIYTKVQNYIPWIISKLKR